jgi:methylthioribose-1-phosphate isomerase
MKRAGPEWHSALPPTVEWTGNALRILDQRLLPHAVTTLTLTSCEEVAEAIRTMAVRGAPAIGCAAAFGLALAARAVAGQSHEAAMRSMESAARMLRATRPTAVNLFHAIDASVSEARAAQTSAEAAERCLRAALQMAEADIQANRAIGEYGASLLPEHCCLLTHCNAGALATAGYGTALGVVRSAYACGKLVKVYADETRPRLQGMQLTAWELMQDGIPVTVIPDGAAASLMGSGKVHAVVVGADRIAANGDVANKIGTRSVAICARYHGIPFYVAAPTTTIDWGLEHGGLIPIEERAPDEVTAIGQHRIAPDGVEVWNPSFDVTPAELVTAIVTERGVVRSPSTENMQNLLKGT